MPDIICDVPEESETNVIETVELWVGITGGILGISTVVAGCVCYIRRRKSKRDGDERADAA